MYVHLIHDICRHQKDSWQGMPLHALYYQLPWKNMTTLYAGLQCIYAGIKSTTSHKFAAVSALLFLSSKLAVSPLPKLLFRFSQCCLGCSTYTILVTELAFCLDTGSGISQHSFSTQSLLFAWTQGFGSVNTASAHTVACRHNVFWEHMFLEHAGTMFLEQIDNVSGTAQTADTEQGRSGRQECSSPLTHALKHSMDKQLNTVGMWQA